MDKKYARISEDALKAIQQTEKQISKAGSGVILLAFEAENE